MNKTRSRYILIIIGIMLLGVQTVAAQQLKLWYDEPADVWTEALPVGNGSLGAMVFGKVHTERIQLNEESVWTGHPIERGKPSAKSYLDSVRQLIFDEKYVEAEKLAQQKIMGKRLDTGTHTYQTLGNLYLRFADSSAVQDYRRELDLNTSLAAVDYQKDGVAYRREIFSSHPHRVLAIRLSADRPGGLTFDLRLNRPSPNEKVTVHENTIVMREHVGDGDGVRYTARLKLDQTGGSVNRTDSTLQVSKADEVIVRLAAATDYRGGNPDIITEDRIKKASGYSYKELKERHIEDYQGLFDRAALHLDGNSPELPTNRRLERVKEGAADPHLSELYFEYGRYLLISSSRPGSLPANLQGLWAQGMAPPWNADYHININLQMNYWPAEVTNLSELAHPLFDFTGHRHISHLYSLYPGNDINAEDTPGLFKAARKTIERRLANGGGHTGWSRAWVINFFARLGNGEKAHQNLLALYRKSTHPNLFDNHPPFQIDGNFGGTAGIAEMLLQSHAGKAELLPALPKAWPEGQVKGLRARGGLTVDISWEKGGLREAKVVADRTDVYSVSYGRNTIKISLQAGQSQTLTSEQFE